MTYFLCKIDSFVKNLLDKKQYFIKTQFKSKVEWCDIKEKMKMRINIMIENDLQITYRQFGWFSRYNVSEWGNSSMLNVIFWGKNWHILIFLDYSFCQQMSLLHWARINQTVILNICCPFKVWIWFQMDKCLILEMQFS